MRRIRRYIWRFLDKNRLLRLLFIIVVIWLIGASLLWMTEGARNRDFDSIGKSLWNIQLPDDEDIPEFEDVYVVQGDPTNQISRMQEMASFKSGEQAIVMAFERLRSLD